MKSILLYIAGTLTGVLILFRSLIFRRLRLTSEEAYTLYELVHSKGKAFSIYEEGAQEDRLPKVYDSLCWLGGIFPFRFSIEERLLRAGYRATDSIAEITVLRWKLKKLLHRVRSVEKKDTGEVPVYLLMEWDAERIGTLYPDGVNEPFLEKEFYADLEDSIKGVVSEKLYKTGALLHGDPGNGKSYLTRYLAVKYKLPIYIVSLMPEMTNHTIIRMFGHLKGPALVLLEDFDNYFNNRECLLEKASFTFDSLLNVFDGMYAGMKGTITILTANDLTKVDPALKKRPGRLRHVIHISTPSTNIKKRVFEGLPIPALDNGCSLDELLAVVDTVKRSKESVSNAI